jgi:hypothetical protein
MAKNIAARRAAKAQRRKAVVAGKRRAEMETSSVGGQVRLAATTPIRHCLVTDGLLTSGTGMGMLVLVRGPTPSHLTMAVFLLDTYGRGVKDVFLRSLGQHEFADYLGRISATTPMVPAEPAYARKLLRDLTDWARQFGNNPHRDVARIEPLFGTTDIAACDAEFEFGQGGLPVLLERLRDPLGPLIDFDDDEDDGDDDTIDVDGVEPGAPALLEEASRTDAD